MQAAANIISNTTMLKPWNMANISKSLTVDEALEVLIPKGFETLISTAIVDGNIVITFVDAEEGTDTSVTINKTIFGSDKVIFPQFLFQVSTLMPKANYFVGQKKFVVNQNELLYMLLQNRFVHFMQQKSAKRRVYLGILRQDIKHLMRYVTYVLPQTYNAKKKLENIYVVLDVFDPKSSSITSPTYKLDFKTKTEMPLGNILRNTRQDVKKFMSSVLRDVPLQPSSVKMAADNSKFVLSDDVNLYRAPGYFPYKDSNGAIRVKSIFAAKQNIAARLQTHLVADAFQFVDADPVGLCQQDNILVNTPVMNERTGQVDYEDKPMAKDATMAGGYVVYMDIDPNSGRFVFGECEQSVKSAERLIIKSDSIEGQFKEIHVAVGDKLTGKALRNCIIGVDLEDENIFFPANCVSIEVTSISNDSLNNCSRISFQCEMEAGSARITTHFGHKAFTKVRPYLGVIEMPDGEQIEVDFMMGMNSVKGKQNSIVATRALLAIKHGLYETSTGALDSRLPKQVNAAAACVPKLKFIDSDGNEHMVWAGYMQYQVTEVARMFSRDKTQAFSFEMGRYIAKQKDDRLFKHIWANYVEPKYKAAVIELQTILQDDIGAYALEEQLPVWQPKDLRNLFKQEDLILNTLSRWPSDSKLLDEETNKGWYLDLSTMVKGAPLVRMPSAKMINLFSSKMQNGQYVYPRIAVEMSKMIQACIVIKDNGMANYGFLYSNDNTKTRLYDSYIKAAHGMLYSSDAMNMSLSATLLKPRIYGINCKQMVDIHIPKGVVVILDDEKYWRFVEVSKDIRDNEGKLIEDLSAEKRADAYSKGLISTLVKDDGDCPMGMTIRNPALWHSQFQVSTIWDKERFATHLWEVHKIRFDDYLSVKHNRNLALISVMDTLIQHSDVDGDLIPVFVVNAEGQKLLRQFILENLDYDEAKWTLQYYQDECAANADLYEPAVYQLHDLPLNHDNANKKTYAEFLMNAAVAKNNIGTATNDIWTLNAIMQLYKSMLDNKGLYDKYLADYCNKVKTAPRQLSSEDMAKIGYLYTRLVEEYVINAIKHMEGGSSSFEIYYLANMTLNDDNARKVASKMIGAPFNMPPKLVHTFMDIVRWANVSGALDAMKNFISMYNKGKDSDPSDFDDVIQANTYIGSLVQPLYEITTKVDNYYDKGWQYKYQGFKPWPVKAEPKKSLIAKVSGKLTDTVNSTASSLIALLQEAKRKMA